MTRARRAALVVVGVTLVASALGVVSAPAPARAAGSYYLFPNARKGIDIPLPVPNKTYRVTVTGTFFFGVSNPPISADAACLYVGDGTQPGVRGDAYARFGNGIAVYVAGGPQTWASTGPVALGCDDAAHADGSPNHTYFVDYAAPPNATMVNVRVNDTNYGDNSKDRVLLVKVDQLADPPSCVGVAVPVVGVCPSVPIPGSVLIDTVSVNAASRNNQGRVPLHPGAQYLLVAQGTYQYYMPAHPNDVADAACAISDADGAGWIPDTTRFPPAQYPTANNPLSLLVNKKAQPWAPANGSATGCNTTDHSYQVAYSPPSPGGVPTFNVNDANTGDNKGMLTVSIYLVPPSLPTPGPSDAATPPYERFQLPANAKAGVTTPVPLNVGLNYRLQVTGTFTFGMKGFTADTACLLAGGLVGARTDLWAKYANGLGVYVNGAQVDWQASGPVGAACDNLTHTYTFDFKAVAPTIHLGLAHDTYYGDNVGHLDVTVFENPNPFPSPVPNRVLVDTIQVSGKSKGTTGTVPLTPGAQYMLEATGRYAWARDPGWLADANCSAQGTSDPWVPDSTRFAQNLYPIPPLSLLVDGAAQPWVATTDSTGTGCNLVDSSYRVVYTPRLPGIPTLRLNDGNTYDNTGAVTVQVFLLPSTNVPNVVPPGPKCPATSQCTNKTLFANDPKGIGFTGLNPSKQYRLQAAGTYSFGVAGITADAGCYQVGGSPGARSDLAAKFFNTPAVTVQNDKLYTKDGTVSWQSTGLVSAGCDDLHHTYTYDPPLGATALLVKVHDSAYGDNADGLALTLIEEPATPSGGVTAPQSVQIDTVQVPSNARTAIANTVPLIPGERYLLEASGAYAYAPIPFDYGDAYCSMASTDPPPLGPTWQTDASRYSDPSMPLSLLLNDGAVAWAAPVTKNIAGCNTTDHTYEFIFTPSVPGRVTFRVNDFKNGGYFGDNSGTLTVKIFQVIPTQG